MQDKNQRCNFGCFKQLLRNFRATFSVVRNL